MAHRNSRSVSVPSSGGSELLNLLPPTFLPHRRRRLRVRAHGEVRKSHQPAVANTNAHCQCARALSARLIFMLCVCVYARICCAHTRARTHKDADADADTKTARTHSGVGVSMRAHMCVISCARVRVCACRHAVVINGQRNGAALQRGARAASVPVQPRRVVQYPPVPQHCPPPPQRARTAA